MKHTATLVASLAFVLSGCRSSEPQNLYGEAKKVVAEEEMVVFDESVIANRTDQLSQTGSRRDANFITISSDIYRIAMKSDSMIYATIIKKSEIPSVDAALVQTWSVNRSPDEKGEKYSRTLDLFDCKKRSTSLLYAAAYDVNHNLLLDSLPMFVDIESTPGAIDDDWMKLVCDGVRGWASVVDPVSDAQRIFDIK